MAGLGRARGGIRVGVVLCGEARGLLGRALGGALGRVQRGLVRGRDWDEVRDRVS